MVVTRRGKKVTSSTKSTEGRVPERKADETGTRDIKGKGKALGATARLSIEGNMLPPDYPKRDRFRLEQYSFMNAVQREMFNAPSQNKYLGKRALVS